MKAIPCQSRPTPSALQLRTHKKPKGAKPNVHATPKRRNWHRWERTSRAGTPTAPRPCRVSSPTYRRCCSPGSFQASLHPMQPTAEDEPLLAERRAGASGLLPASGRRQQLHRSRRGAGKDRNPPCALPGHPHCSPSVAGWEACHLFLQSAALGTPALLICSSNFPTGAQGARL